DQAEGSPAAGRRGSSQVRQAARSLAAPRRRGDLQVVRQEVRGALAPLAALYRSARGLAEGRRGRDDRGRAASGGSDRSREAAGALHATDQRLARLGLPKERNQLPAHLL